MDNKCFKCKTVIPADTRKPITCDLCKVHLCKGCSQLSSSEVKVMELAQRRMIYSCPECVLKPNENVIGNEIKKFMEMWNVKIKKWDEEYIQKTEYLLNIIEQKDINIKKFVKEQLQDLKKDVESHISNLYEDSSKNKMDKNKNINTTNKQTTHSIATTSKIMKPKANTRKTSQSSITTKIDKPNTPKSYHEIERAQRELANGIINLGQVDYYNNTNTNNARVRNEHHQEDKFIQVNSKKKWRRRGNIGTGDDNQNDDAKFEGSAVWKNRKLWVIIKKVKDSADAQKIKEYLNNKLDVEDEEDISVKCLNTYYKIKDNNCYLIGFDNKFKNSIYDSKLWPKGVIFERFDFQKGERFLDKQKYHKNETGKNDHEDMAEDFHVA